MDQSPTDAIDTRRKFVEAWNETIIDIWQEKIMKLGVFNTGSLWQSTVELPVKADGRFYDITLSQTFLEYGLWQDFGTGRNTAIGNTHRRDNDGWSNKRQRRRWFSIKYYSSAMKLRDFMAESLGHEFKSMFCAALDADNARYNTEYYRRKGYTR
ncbi:hypothetical protein [Muribaculum intestinale]|uniref:hypothetical protein n=1 Tax=Muribaculum intestinale TaxID=1796646 RepID=UPI0025A9773D|nr:hypothetical protein [Muribaculum intestinale]